VSLSLRTIKGVIGGKGVAPLIWGEGNNVREKQGEAGFGEVQKNPKKKDKTPPHLASGEQLIEAKTRKRGVSIYNKRERRNPKGKEAGATLFPHC